jgi:hypothetical protein
LHVAFIVVGAGFKPAPTQDFDGHPTSIITLRAIILSLSALRKPLTSADQRP